MKIFIDTSAFIALAHPNDGHHTQALQRQATIADQRIPLFTSNAIVYETITWLAIKAGAMPAAEFGEGLARGSRALTCLRLTAEDEMYAMQILRKFHNLPLSFADASSIQLIHKNRLDAIFTFDDHFRKAGLTLF